MRDQINGTETPSVQPGRRIGSTDASRAARRSARLAGYSAAVTAVVAGAAEAEEFFLEFEFEIPQFTNQPLDLNLDGTQTDLNLKNYIFNGGNYQGATVPYAPGQIVGFTSAQSSFPYVSVLQPGDPINASTVGPSFYGNMSYNTNTPNAQWNLVDDGYLGLSFPAGDTTFYAWVRVDVDNANGTMYLHDAYASDDPAGIVAGQVPIATLEGDYNDSGQVEQGDLDLVLTNWGSDTDQSGIPAGWDNDLPSGLIDQAELDGVLLNWGNAVASPDFGGSPVPEPGALGLLAAGAAGLTAMRRRHRFWREAE